MASMKIILYRKIRVPKQFFLKNRLCEKQCLEIMIVQTSIIWSAPADFARLELEARVDAEIAGQVDDCDVE